MTGVKVFALSLAASILTLSSPVHAQDQTVAEPYHKWLDCDVSWMFTRETVGSTFSVRMTYRNSPVANVPLTLGGEGKTLPSAVTNSDGIAHFDRVPTGEYWARSPDGLLFPSVQFEVKADQPLGKRVNLEWPVIMDSIAHRFLRGKFTVAEDENGPDIPLRNAPVELRNVYPGKLIESVSTDANGDYEFSTTDPELYSLRLTLPKKGEAGSDIRDLPIELDPAAKQFSIPEMTVVQSHCDGIQLFRRSQGNEGWEPQ